MLGVLLLGAVSCALGLLDPPSEGVHGGAGRQLMDMIRVLSTTALAIGLLLGPGALWRASARRHTPSLGFVFLPGIFMLAAVGGLAWALATHVEPRIVCFAALAPTLGLVFGGLMAAGPEDIFEPEEQRALLLTACALGFAVARSLWSLGPAGELYGGTVSRTLEVGDRSDARISYNVVQLVAHGTKPFSPGGAYYFFPYDFSSRGPLPGLASAPVVLMSGGRPPVLQPEMPFAPFDAQGFMAYRLAMMTFGCTAFVAVWDLVRRLGGIAAARFALLLAITTPFLVHEVWFTWPKMLTAAFVLLAGICVIERRALRSGLLLGAGYLMHPGALVSISGIGLLSLWPLKDANWRRPQVVPALLFIAGVAVSVVAWRLVCGSHYTQGGFIEYFTESGSGAHPGLLAWLAYRLASIGNTLVPLLLPVAFSHSVSINIVGGSSPTSVHFFFQYWNGIPFGFAIVFFPLLILSLWRAWKLWRWPVLAAVVIPFFAFAVYWGSSKTGLMREGLQAWALVALAVVALQQAHDSFPWFRSKPVRLLLTLRVGELLLIALGPTLATTHLLISRTFMYSDTIAVLGMTGIAAGLAWLVWNDTEPPVAERAKPDEAYPPDGQTRTA